MKQEDDEDEEDEEGADLLGSVSSPSDDDDSFGEEEEEEEEEDGQLTAKETRKNKNKKEKENKEMEKKEGCGVLPISLEGALFVSLSLLLLFLFLFLYLNFTKVNLRTTEENEDGASLFKSNRGKDNTTDSQAIYAKKEAIRKHEDNTTTASHHQQLHRAPIQVHIKPGNPLNHHRSSPSPKGSVSEVFSAHCFVNVLGLHHSGTGVLASVAVELFPGNNVSYFHATGVAEDEGQHLQGVFPTVAFRTRGTVCAANASVATDRQGSGHRFQGLATMEQCAYICPAMLSEQKYISERARQTLFRQWSRFWDLDKYFLLQKTPSLDALYFARMFAPHSVQIIVIRHPVFWTFARVNCRTKRHGDMLSAARCAVKWLYIWSGFLHQLSRYELESADNLSKDRGRKQEQVNYVVVRFESILQNKAKVKSQLRDYLNQNPGCRILEPIPSSGVKKNSNSSTNLSSSSPHEEGNGHEADNRSKGRKLELRREGDINMKFLWDPKMLRWWKACLEVEHCKKYLEKAEEGARLFGYTLLSTKHPLLLQDTQEEVQHAIIASNINPFPAASLKNLDRAMKSLPKPEELDTSASFH